MAIAASLARKRAQERTVRERERFLKDEFNATCVAKWEQRTSNRIDKQDLVNRAKRMAEKDVKDLQIRQSKIRNLYESEWIQWEKDLEESTRIPIEDRIKAIREKATRLQEKREKEKRNFVMACNDRRWREGCDDVRTLNAKTITANLMYDRKNALDIKKSDCSNDEENERSQLMQDFERKEREKALVRQKKNIDTKQALDEQVRINQFRKQRADDERRKEEAEQLKRWSLEDTKKKQEELQLLKDAHDRGRRMVVANKERNQERDRDREKKREEENIMLNYALKKESNDLAFEAEQRSENKDAAKEYVIFLREQMIKEKQDTSEVEKVRDAAMENIWCKRDAALKAQEDARNKLLLDVNASRDKQILEKNRRAEELKQQEAIEVKRNLMLWEKQQQDERVKEERKKQQIVENMLWNKKIVESKRQEDTLEKQKQFLFQKQISHAEKEYHDRIQKEAGKVRTYFPRRGSDLALY